MCAFNSISNSFETVKEGKSFVYLSNKGGPMRNNVGNRFINYGTTYRLHVPYLRFKVQKQFKKKSNEQG